MNCTRAGCQNVIQGGEEFFAMDGIIFCSEQCKKEWCRGENAKLSIKVGEEDEN